MRIDATEFLPPQQPLPSVSLPSPGSQAPSSFADWMASQIGDVNRQMVDADRGMQELATGGAANLHDVMIRLEQAKLSLQLMLQVRNHLLDAYQELVRTQN